MLAWWRGLRAAGRIAARDARRAKGRTALVAVMVGLPILVGGLVGTLALSTVPTPARQAQAILGDQAQARIGGLIQPGLAQDATATSWYGADAPGAVEPVDVASYEDALAGALPAGDRLVAVRQGGARLSTGDLLAPGWSSVLEAPAEDLAALVVPDVRDGTLPDAPGQVAVGAAWARALQVGVGDRITLQPEQPSATGGVELGEATAEVVGVLAPAAGGASVYAVPGTVLPAPADAGRAAWFVLGDAPVTWQHVRAINELGSTVVSRHVVAHPPTRAELAALGIGADDGATSAGAVAMIAGVGALGVLEAVLLIGPAFAVGARRSARQLAVLASAGAERRHLRQVVLLGGVVIGAASSLVALVAGVALAAVVRWVCLALDVMAFPDLRVPWSYLPWGVVLGLVVATAAAWFPARAASRQDVVAALSGRRSEARPRRAVPVAGLVVLAAGLVAAAASVRSASTPLLVGGVVGIELGLVLSSGALVALVGRLAPRLGVAGRFAVRDAVRQRGRTAPAVAAIVAAIAGVVTAAVYVESGEQHRRAQYQPLAAEGVVVASFSTEGDDVEARAAAVERALRATLPVRDVVAASLAVAPGSAGRETRDPQGADLPVDETWVAVERPPDQRCPLDDLLAASPAERRELGRDPRCVAEGSYQVVWTDAHGGGGTLVDDGAVVGRLGFAGAQDDAAALRSGAVLVSDERALWPDGTVHLALERWDAQTGEHTTDRSLVVPGRVSGMPAQYGLVVPPPVMDDLGYVAVPVGFLATTTRMPSETEESRAALALMRADGAGYVTVERGYRGEQPLVVWLLALAAVVVGLGATGISVALAGAEARPDLATLAAVGAAPGVRRRVAAAQAAVLVVLGASVGTVTGLVLGRVLVVSERARFEVYDPTWLVVVPWPAIAAVALGVPLLATGGAWLLTRSRLPMVSRIAA
ncbi:FtsX-like permease family protein [Cellulomonas massiliensis]|uniref:FtsX-like permease family protein n=1 Tax=Cellulomonas massiliensis TaxID=1465811 RepID=UPI0002F23FDE|nr:FtsX-like permease family protein [Cellulomonas massiliensis]